MNLDSWTSTSNRGLLFCWVLKVVAAGECLEFFGCLWRLDWPFRIDMTSLSYLEAERCQFRFLGLFALDVWTQWDLFKDFLRGLFAKKHLEFTHKQNCISKAGYDFIKERLYFTMCNNKVCFVLQKSCHYLKRKKYRRCFILDIESIAHFRLHLQDEGEENSGMIITDEIGAPWFYKSFL